MLSLLYLLNSGSADAYVACSKAKSVGSHITSDSIQYRYHLVLGFCKERISALGSYFTACGGRRTYRTIKRSCQACKFITLVSIQNQDNAFISIVFISMGTLDTKMALRALLRRYLKLNVYVIIFISI